MKTPWREISPECSNTEVNLRWHENYVQLPSINIYHIYHELLTHEFLTKLKIKPHWSILRNSSLQRFDLSYAEIYIYIYIHTYIHRHIIYIQTYMYIYGAKIYIVLALYIYIYIIYIHI